MFLVKSTRYLKNVISNLKHPNIDTEMEKNLIHVFTLYTRLIYQHTYLNNA